MHARRGPAPRWKETHGFSHSSSKQIGHSACSSATPSRSPEPIAAMSIRSASSPLTLADIADGTSGDTSATTGGGVTDTQMLRLVHLCDATLPTGGFAHSGGLEAALMVPPPQERRSPELSGLAVQQFQVGLSPPAPPPAATAAAAAAEKQRGKATPAGAGLAALGTAELNLEYDAQAVLLEDTDWNGRPESTWSTW